METGLGGPQRDPERVGDRPGGKADVVVEDEDGARLGPEPLEASLELVAIDHATGHIAGVGRVTPVTARPRSPPLPPSEDVEAGVDDQAVEPGVEAVGIA